MPKRTVEIDDDLEETVERVKEEILDNFKEYFDAHPEMSEWDEYYQGQGGDVIHEIVDSNTPIYSSHIDGLYFLYGDEFDEAYKNAGIGNGTEDNHRQVAIYCYLEEKGWDYLRELEQAFNDWLEAQPQKGIGNMPWDYL